MRTRPTDTTTWAALTAAACLFLASPIVAAPPGSGDPEICDDGIDNDGDRKVDCDDRDCRDDAACTGGGGDGGGDSGGSVRYDYEGLPTVERGAGALDISEDRDWVAGFSVRTHRCQTYAQGPAIWERMSGGGWLLHELPGLDGVAKGNAGAIVAGGTTVGWEFIYSADCSEFVGRPVLWEPIAAGTWSITELPSPAGGGNAQGAEIVSGVGLVIAGAAGGQATVWREVGGDWVMQSLGSLDDNSVAHAVSSTGAVVGASSLADWSAPRPFIVIPADTDADGVPDTWYQDADADGRNDLMSPLDDAGRALGVSVASAACGDAPGATHWEADGAGGWLATTLPVGTYSDGTTADDLNDLEQVVGDGRRPKGRGSEQEALLWEPDGTGAWTLTNLNDVTELPRSVALRRATAANNCGDIVGSAETQDDNSQPCILTPRSSPCD